MGRSVQLKYFWFFDRQANYKYIDINKNTKKEHHLCSYNMYLSLNWETSINKEEVRLSDMQKIKKNFFMELTLTVLKVELTSEHNFDPCTVRGEGRSLYSAGGG